MLLLEIQNRKQEVLLSNSGEEEVTIAYRGQYQEGDRIVLRTTEYPIVLELRLDDSLDDSYVYITKESYCFTIPFGNAKKPYGEKAFQGERHWGYVRKVVSEKKTNYRNLAHNAFDLPNAKGIYPHASSNVIQTNPQFLARNVIDGIFETSNHGSYPHGSWSTNQIVNPTLKIAFGRVVSIDQILLYLRADYPHDSCWKAVNVTFSDGSKIQLDLKKHGNKQSFMFQRKNVSWLQLEGFKKFSDSSPFVALSQIEVWGTEYEIMY